MTLHEDVGVSGGTTPRILNLDTRWREVGGQFHEPTALSTGKEPPVLIGQKTVWAPEPVWTRWRREKILSLTLPGIELRSSNH
jgi:hypothetical protein